MTGILLKPQPGLIQTPEDAERHNAEVALAEQMAEILQKLYPMHRWATFADTRQGIVWVALPDLMGPTLRYVGHVEKLTTYSELCKWLREAGGHILERFRQPRGKRDDDLYAEARLRVVVDNTMPE